MERKTERLIAGWLDRYPSANTQAAYRRDLAAFCDWCATTGRHPLAAAANDVDAYRDDCLAAGASTATVARRLSGLASFYRHVAGSGRAGAPTEGGRPLVDVARPVAADPGEAPVLGAEDVAALLDAAQAQGEKAAALVTLLVLDGAKLGEALQVDVADVKLRGSGTTCVVLTRRGEQRDLPVSHATAAALAAYIAARRDGPLFLGDSPVARRPERLTRYGADFIIKRAGADAGIAVPLSATLLRRSYMTEAHWAGHPLSAIARQVGHREQRETARVLRGRQQP